MYQKLFTICFCMLNSQISAASLIIGHYSKLAANEAVISNTTLWKSVNSGIECAAFCISTNTCIGFQFGILSEENVTGIICSLFDENVTFHERQSQSGVSIFVSENVNIDIESTSTDPTTSTTLPSTSETTVPSTTGTTLTTVPSTTETTGTSIPAITTLPPFGPCVVDAAFTRQYDIVVFSGVWMHFYNSSLKLLEGPYQSKPISTYIPGLTGPIDGAYVDSIITHLYVIKGSEVRKYQLSDLSLQTTETTAQHFDTFATVPATIDDVTLHNTNLAILDAGIVYTSSQNVPLSLEDPSNLFDYIVTPLLPPTGVTGVTLTLTATYLFFSGGEIHHYTPNITGNNKGLYHYFGTLAC